MKKMRKLAALGMSVAMTLSMAACGGSSTTTETTKAADTAETQSGAESSGEVDKSQQLIIYTNSGSNGRDEWLKQFGTIPCQPDALAQADEDITEFVNQVHAQDMDWQFISDHIEAWVEKCELEFMQ